MTDNASSALTSLSMGYTLQKFARAVSKSGL
jgi:hypothetical protein